MVTELFSGLVGAIIGGLLTSNATKMNELDSKSGWREKLFDLSSKDKMYLSDIYLLRATLRFDKHKSNTYEKNSFKDLSNEISDFCEDMVIQYKDDENSEKEQSLEINNKYHKEIIRIYARYLLKMHWETFSRKFLFFNNGFKVKGEKQMGIDTRKIIEEVNHRNDKNYERNINAINNYNDNAKLDEIFEARGLSRRFWIASGVVEVVLIIFAITLPVTSEIINAIFIEREFDWIDIAYLIIQLGLVITGVVCLNCGAKEYSLKDNIKRV